MGDALTNKIKKPDYIGKRRIVPRSFFAIRRYGLQLSEVSLLCRPFFGVGGWGGGGKITRKALCRGFGYPALHPLCPSRVFLSNVIL